jgi:hypothetical protein
VITFNKIFATAISVSILLLFYSVTARSQVPSMVATVMDASFTLVFAGVSGSENDGFDFFIDPDRIIINEPSLSDHPGKETTYQALMLTSIGEWKCRDKHNPAFDPSVTYNQACARLMSRTANSFVMEHVFRSILADRSEVVWRYSASAQRTGIICQARLISYHRTYRNMPGVFRSPAAITRQSCRAL